MFDKKPHIKFNKNGLIPAIVLNADTQEVINLVYMNRKALKKTQETGKLWLYNRSLKKIWMKGQRSGNTVDVEEIRSHVDKYALLISGTPNGAPCHTGDASCFSFAYWKKDEALEGDPEIPDSFKKIFSGEEESYPAEFESLKDEISLSKEEETGLIEMREVENKTEQAEIEPDSFETQQTPDKNILYDFYWSIANRVENPMEGSVISKLHSLGVREISKHLGRDVMDVTMASLQKDKKTTIRESVELLRHWLLLLIEQGITLSEVYDELEKRL
ncbi:bifunctional phosphoribosyl-AMP cyclohydrolase/phosphoribosyl-ATP pyrophosphatase protein [bacterium BMS3Bbin03]|nr:bifunctional phosphoribosyl-AMP cyclohydrolase/phosphoribosyl-ATP pyrophosphatase protein [bacterium BMS3Bbin03]